MSRNALVMEGGAMRGMFTCGVIDVFMENGIDFDGAIGVSAGAAFGCNIKSKQIGRPIRYNKKYCNKKYYASVSSWLKTGDLYNVKFCYDELVYKYDLWDQETFAANPMEFIVVATDVVTGKPVYYKCIDGGKEDIQWIRASASIPVAANPVEIGEGVYLDGGISDSIPLEYMETQGYDRYLVIETQPKDYVKHKQKGMFFIKLFLKKYPNMVETMRTRSIMYNHQKEYVSQREKDKDVLVIRPEKPLNIGAACKKPEELERVYQLGRKAATDKLDEIKAFLEEER